MVADDVIVGSGEFENAVVSGSHADLWVTVEDVGFAFEWAGGGIGDGVGDSVSGVCPAAFGPHEVVLAVFFEHEGAFDVVFGGDFKEFAFGFDHVFFELDNVAMFPAAVVEIGLAVVIDEGVGVYGLGAVDIFFDEGFAEGIFEWSGG